MNEADVLVTGANGFIGSHVLKRFDRTGMGMVATTRQPSWEDENQCGFENTRFVHLDLAKKETFETLPASIDTVVHVAAALSDSLPARTMMRANVEGTLNLIEYAVGAGAKRFIFCSSISVHGDIVGRVVDHDTEIRNPGPYGLSKRAGEILLGDVCSDLPSVSLRLPGVLGAGAKDHWLANVLAAARKGEEITVFNEGSRFNNALDVNSLADFMIHLSRSDLEGARAFPLASRGATTIGDAVQTVIDHTNSKSRVVETERNKTSFTIDNTLAENFGFKPLDINEALAAYCCQ